ncbi:hypothetical protein AYI96_16415 [Shewanella sp. MSW]|nr:hypothetical protein AYI96_16415 [Shewanella sp. MSW]
MAALGYCRSCGHDLFQWSGHLGKKPHIFANSYIVQLAFVFIFLIFIELFIGPHVALRLLHLLNKSQHLINITRSDNE